MERSAISSPDQAVEYAAQYAHEANRAYCESIGDNSQSPWPDASDHTKESARTGIRAIWNGEVRTPEDSHNSWLRFKEADGWHYGPVKDEVRKTHPCFVPYKDLPDDMKIKDYIFHAVAKATLVILGRSPAA